MNGIFEFVEFDDVLPVKGFVHSVESFSMHWHPELEILLVLKGSVFVTLQSETYSIGEGELIVIGGSQMHSVQQTIEPNQIVTLQINCAPFAFFDPDIATTGFDCHGGISANPRIEGIRASACLIFQALLYQQSGFRHLVAEQIQSILSTLRQHFPARAVRSMENIKQRDRERMNRIIEYIQQNHDSRVSLADISAREYISVSHLSTFIKQALGMSFGEYLNSVRLKSLQEKIQNDTETPVDEICAQCGFSSPQFARSLFKNAFGTTPGKYRRLLQQKNKAKAQATGGKSSYAMVYHAGDFTQTLRRWSHAPDTRQGEQVETRGGDVRVDARGKGEPYHRACLKIITIGRAYEGLLSQVQRQLRQAQEDIGFTYLRFHGIFSDDMMILKPDASGATYYSWRLVDALFDFLLEIGLTPFVELTYMPSLLASGTETVFAWQGNITPPADLGAWARLVCAFVSHCVERYGEKEVVGWYFEVWNEPDYTGVSWAGTQQEFFRFFAETAWALRRALPQARICGPSITSVGISSRRWLAAFCEYCRLNDVPLDVITFHAYPEILDPDNLRDAIKNISNRIYQFSVDYDIMGENYVEEMIRMVRGQLGEWARLPLAITEWNLTMAVYNPINDSAFAGTSLLATALRCDAQDVLLAHWTLTDYMEEQLALPPQELHGGFGLLTCGGVRKPTYWAIWALARLGNEVIARPANGVVTRSGDEYRLLAFYHPETAQAYTMVYAREMGAEEEAGALAFTWTLTGMSGSWRARRYAFDALQCDAKTIQLKRGLREPMTKEELAFLIRAAQPVYRAEALYAELESGALHIPFSLRLCSFELVILTREA